MKISMRCIVALVTCFVYSLNAFATEAQLKRRNKHAAPYQNKKLKVEQVPMDLEYDNDSPHKMHAAYKSDFPSNNIQDFKILMTENPLEFIDAFGDWAPSSLDPTDPLFQTFYEQTFKIIKPYDSFSNAGSDAWRLANILLELETWVHVGYKVEEHIRSEVNPELEEKIRRHIWQHIGSKTRDEIKSSIFDILSERVKNDLCHKVWFKVYEQMNEVKKQLGDQVASGLKQFALDEIEENANIDDAIKPAINYLTVIYRWGGLALWHSDAFKEFHSELASLITGSMNEQEIRSSLLNLKIPHHPEDSYTVTAPVCLISSMSLSK